MSKSHRVLIVLSALVLLTASTASIAPASAQEAPAEAAADDVAALLVLPTMDLSAPPAAIAEQLATYRNQLGRVEQALTGPMATDELATVAFQLRTGVAILEAFADPLPIVDTDAEIDALRGQAALFQILLESHRVLADQAREAGLAMEVTGTVNARVTTIETALDQLEGALAVAEATPAEVPAAAIQAPAPQSPPAPSGPVAPVAADVPPVLAPEPPPGPAVMAPEPEPAGAPAPPPEANAVAGVEPPPGAQTPAGATDLDQRIADFVARDLPILTLDAPVPELQTQLQTYTQLRVEGETLLGEGRLADGNIVAIAERVAELQQRVSALNAAIAAAAGAAPVGAAPPDVIEQLAAGGDAEAAEQVRTLRGQLLNGLLQIGFGQLPQLNPDVPQQVDPPPTPFGAIVGTEGERTVFLQGDQYQVRRTTTEEMDRLLYQAYDVQTSYLGGGYTRTTIYRTDGSRVVTVTDRYGQVMERSRIEADGTVYDLIQNQYPQEQEVVLAPPMSFDDLLPPLQLTIPYPEYVVEADRVTSDQIIAALTAPPVELVERTYTLDEIRFSERLRDKMRRVDLTTITFALGSAAISPDQFDELAEIGRAIETILAASPVEVFLIEGHADAVGSDYRNLLLSDRRAETIAVALSQNFNIPPENLITQGYGEQFLKIPTLEAERQNRRGVVLRITPLLAGPGAS